MDLQWVVILSWHVVRPGGQQGWYETVCGRHAVGPLVEQLPAGVKSCETCETVVLRRADKPTLNTRSALP